MSSSNRTTPKGGKGAKGDKAHKIDKSDTGKHHLTIQELFANYFCVQAKDLAINSTVSAMTPSVQSQTTLSSKTW